MLPGNVLFVITLRADLTISGLAYRLMAAWRHLYELEAKETVFLITTRSLWEKIYGDEAVEEKYITVIDDRTNYRQKAIQLPLTVIRNIKRNRIKIMHTNGNYLLLPVHYLKKVLGIKTVVTFGSASIEMASTYSKWAGKQWKMVLNAATAIDVLNPINTINGYNSQKFVSACSFPFNSSLKAKKESGNIAKSDIITFVGSLTSQKNPLLALHGFRLYLRSSDYPHAKLEIFGKGVQKTEVLILAEEINKEQGAQVVFVHETDIGLYDKLRESRIFLSLQDHTNYPSQSLMEAMIFGNSVIATDFGDTNHMVIADNGNILISAKKPELVAEAIKMLLKSPITFNQKNANFIGRHHNINLFGSYLKNLYRTILK